MEQSDFFVPIRIWFRFRTLFDKKRFAKQANRFYRAICPLFDGLPDVYLDSGAVFQPNDIFAVGVEQQNGRDE